MADVSEDIDMALTYDDGHISGSKSKELTQDSMVEDALAQIMDSILEIEPKFQLNVLKNITVAKLPKGLIGLLRFAELNKAVSQRQLESLRDCAQQSQSVDNTLTSSAGTQAAPFNPCQDLLLPPSETLQESVEEPLQGLIQEPLQETWP